MKDAEAIAISNPKHRAVQRGTSREIDSTLLKFVEALAIADARRDHRFGRERLMKDSLGAASEKPMNGDVQNEARSNLCSVLDRASKRKVD